MTKDSFKFFATLISAVLLLLTSCATKTTARRASEYLYNTDRSVSKVLLDIQAAFEKNKYLIKKVDMSAGVLVTHPRKYNYNRGSQKIMAQQSVQIRVEGGSIKVRIVYECNYKFDQTTFEPCQAEDKDSSIKIRRLEPALLSELKPLFMKATAPAPAAAVTVDAPAATSEAPVAPATTDSSNPQ